MKREKPTVGISTSAEYDNAICFTVQCDCMSHEHSINTWVEVNAEKDLQCVEVSFYVQKQFTFFEKLKFLFSGSNTIDHEIILSKQTALNWISAVKDALDFLEEK